MTESDLDMGGSVDATTESDKDVGGSDDAPTLKVNIQSDPAESMDKCAQKSEKENNTSKFGELFKYYADRVSMHGLSFLVGTKNRIVKVIWTMILLYAIYDVCHQVYSLAQKYLKYDTRTEILISYSSIQFPAVTVCNVNVVRKSMVTRWSEDTNHTDGHNETQFTNSTIHEFIDVQANYFVKNNPGSWETVSIKSEHSVYEELQKSYYSMLSGPDQQEIGHQSYMIQSCTFAERNCIQEFKTYTSADYGNCYTVEDKRFISKKTGPLGGLELVLFLEIDEYLDHLTDGKGVQVVIHAQNTVPIPDEEGFTIPAGYQANIGLKETKITRLGEPYTPCVKDKYRRLYNVTYSRALCQKICYIKRIAHQCDCQDTRYFHVNEIIKLNMNRSCLNWGKDLECVVRIKSTFKADDAKCNCVSPCSERIYNLQIGYLIWPYKGWLHAWAAILCLRFPERCDEFQMKSEEDFRENFVKLNIFFNDLNVEHLVERKNYEFTQLLSAFGGSLGFWVGLSVISVLEITHLLLGLLQYMLCKIGSERLK